MRIKRYSLASQDTPRMQEIVQAILGSTFASDREPNTNISSFVFAPSSYAKAEMASSTPMTQTIQDLLCGDHVHGSNGCALPRPVDRERHKGAAAFSY